MGSTILRLARPSARSDQRPQESARAAALRLQSVDVNIDHATGKSEQQEQKQRKIGSGYTIK